MITIRKLSIALLSILAIGIAFAIIPVYSGTAEAQMGGGMREMMQRMMPDRPPPLTAANEKD